MKIIFLVLFSSAFLCSACSISPQTPARSTDEGMLNFLPYLNQKVSGYLIENNVQSLDSEIYKGIVDEVCGPLPSCGKDAATMYQTYNVQPRLMKGIFSVMLCDKNESIKIMEDFSCNEQNVEIKSYQINPTAKCAFEENWQEKITKDCPNI